MTDFVLTLHCHLPWVLHHGRWPHGSDWLCEAAVDTYLPLLIGLDTLEHQRVASPLTMGVTPILANQLAHPDFGQEIEAFLTPDRGLRRGDRRVRRHRRDASRPARRLLERDFAV